GRGALVAPQQYRLDTMPQPPTSFSLQAEGLLDGWQSLLRPRAQSEFAPPSEPETPRERSRRRHRTLTEAASSRYPVWRPRRHPSRDPSERIEARKDTAPSRYAKAGEPEYGTDSPVHRHRIVGREQSPECRKPDTHPRRVSYPHCV